MFRHRPDLVGNVDAVGLHPYTPTVEGVFQKIREFRRTLEGVGIGGVPLEITEIGWTTADTPEAERAESLRRLADELPAE